MKKGLFILLCAMMIAAAAACKKERPPVAEEEEPAAPEAVAPPGAAGRPNAAQGMVGEVLETMDAAGYTYIQVDTGQENIWAAAPKFQVAVGDEVVVPQGMLMENYHSKSMDRDFEQLHFVQSVAVVGAEPEESASPPVPQTPPANQAAEEGESGAIDFSTITKAPGGRTVAEIFADRAALDQTEVVVRGKVVKFTPQIMGRNWIHIQDGTGGEGANDLTVTSADSARTGDTVLVRGVVAVDKDFGAGYRYDVILESAEITIE